MYSPRLINMKVRLGVTPIQVEVQINVSLSSGELILNKRKYLYLTAQCIISYMCGMANAPKVPNSKGRILFVVYCLLPFKNKLDCFRIKIHLSIINYCLKFYLINTNRQYILSGISCILAVMYYRDFLYILCIFM